MGSTEIWDGQMRGKGGEACTHTREDELGQGGRKSRVAVGGVPGSLADQVKR